MKKRATLLLVGLMAATMVGLVACDDEDTQQAANEQFCDDAAELIASLRVIRDLDRNSTLDEVQEARERARNAYDSMIESAAGVVDTRLDDVQQAYDDLIAAVDAIDSEDTIGEALDSVDEELENLATETSQVLNDVDCSGLEPGGSGAE